jgi:hypothetical protein
MNVDWEVMFPLTTVHNLSRDVSEHNPIILDKMEVGDRKPKCLKFKKKLVVGRRFPCKSDKGLDASS